MSRQFLTTDHYEEIRFSIASLYAGRVLRSDTLQLVLDDAENGCGGAINSSKHFLFISCRQKEGLPQENLGAIFEARLDRPDFF